MREPTQNPFEPFFEEIRRLIREEIAAFKSELNGQDRLLDAEEAARVLGVAPTWLYKHHPKLPFAVKLHHKMLRFSAQGIQRYIAARKRGLDRPL